jgi:hypothetical protein
MTNNNTTKETTMLNSINDIFDNINSDIDVIGNSISIKWDDSDMYDGVVVLNDWDGNDIYVSPITNKIVGWRFYGSALHGIDIIA